jgi:hypothetical protein
MAPTDVGFDVRTNGAYCLFAVVHLVLDRCDVVTSSFRTDDGRAKK